MNKLTISVLLALLVSLSGCASPAPEATVGSFSSRQQVEVLPQTEANFSQLNPHYKDRAGVFYDIRYVSPSAEALFKIADIRPDQMRETMRILRLFVDEWLESYVEGNGAISPTEVERCVQRMDKRFDGLLNDLQRKQYRIWRDDSTGEHNKLRFLMSCPPTKEERDAQPFPGAYSRRAADGLTGNAQE